jgi:hypothetical protein
MIKYMIAIGLFVALVISCNQKTERDANDIINNSIEVSGGELIKKSTINFDFRDIHYRAMRENGKFVLERSFTDKSYHYFDTITQITDAITNKGFQRLVNAFPVTVLDSMAAKYTASINSVHYFSVLPYGLNGEAVNKTYLEAVKLKGNIYHKIKITFNEEGGGEDFEDEFVYWVNVETFKTDYIAYSYNEPDGLGLRFREAYNERYVNGIRFVDYNNFKPKENTVLLEKLDELFEQGELQLLSKIELENISVN